MGEAPSKFETLTWLSDLYPGDSITASRQLLAEHVRAEPEEYADLVRSVAEGAHDFKKRVRQVIGTTLYGAAVPRSYRALARPPLSEVFAGVKRADRRQTIIRAHVVHGYLLTEIANYLELHPTTISRIINHTGSYRLTRD
jgi:DNA-binding NarL/FixJ family response regulator